MVEIAPKFFGPLKKGDLFKNNSDQYYLVKDDQVRTTTEEEEKEEPGKGDPLFELILYRKNYSNNLEKNGTLFVPRFEIEGNYYIQTPKFSGYEMVRVKGGKSKKRRYKKYGTKRRRRGTKRRTRVRKY